MSLPKFLIADDGGERDFVIHCHYPRFVMEVLDGTGKPEFFDSEADFIQQEIAIGREPAQTLARILREAADFYAEQL